MFAVYASQSYPFVRVARVCGQDSAEVTMQTGSPASNCRTMLLWRSA
jgi:hypothetical protein